jgi:DNA-directed RNA polymerase subunit RPC12/RpoP
MDDDAPIPIACTECSNQVGKTYEWLTGNPLECPVCGHKMTAERAAVLQHVEAIRKAIAAIAR